LVEHPTNNNVLALAATYGIVTTSDRGGSWYHICEASFADLASYTGDPLLDFTNDGALLVGVQTTINASRDGCVWKATIGGANTFVVDHTLVRSAPATVVALLANYRNGTVDYALWKSTDGGEGWFELASVPVETAYTIDVDDADDNHIYVTGVSDNVGQLLRSSDGGRTWTQRPIPNTNLSEAPYLAALHPGDARRLYVRTDSWVPIGTDLAAHDALLYSSDGGDTWTELFRNRAKLLGFALSPDGKTVLLGYGDPFTGGTTAVTGPLGIFKSSTDAFVFEPIFSAHVSCLAWTRAGVYVCASQHFDKFELGFSPSPDFGSDGGCLTPLLHLPEVKGPLACPAGTPGARCNGSWIAACASFGACDDAGTRSRECIGRDGGAVGGAGGGNGAVDGSLPPPSAGDDSGDCGCRVGVATSRAPGTALALLAVFSVLRRRRPES
jgi:hypothetical protein